MTPPLTTIATSYGISSPNALKALSRRSSTRHYAKGQLLFSQGEPQHSITFITSGVARTFHTDDSGNEVTNCLIDHLGMPALPSPDLDSPAVETAEALTDLDAVLLDAKTFKTLVATDPAVARAYQQILAEAWHYQWETKMVIRRKSALERYLWFLGEYPGLIDRISHRHVASFLAMAPETLARVRKGLAQRDGGK